MIKARKSLARAAATILTAATLTLLALPGTATAAPAEACWTYSKEHTVTKLGVALMDDQFALRWCASSGRVTKLWVDDSEAAVRNSAWVKDAQQDTRQRGEFGQPTLHVVAHFSVASTISKLTASLKGGAKGVSAEAKAEVDPGRLNDLFDITLYGDGRVTGTNWSG